MNSNSDGRKLVVVGMLLLLLLSHHSDGTKPQPAPFPTTGLHVLIVEETDDRISLTPEQRKLMLATAPGTFPDYCRKKCGPEGFYIMDKDDDPNLMPSWVQEAWKRPRSTLPFLEASDGKAGVEGLLNDTTAAAVRKLGG